MDSKGSHANPDYACNWKHTETTELHFLKTALVHAKFFAQGIKFQNLFFTSNKLDLTLILTAWEFKKPFL
jgi:hypothetical protein